MKRIAVPTAPRSFGAEESRRIWMWKSAYDVEKRKLPGERPLWSSVLRTLPLPRSSLYNNLELPEPKNHFTVGTVDDVTFTSARGGRDSARRQGLFEAKFYGLGADGTCWCQQELRRSSATTIGQAPSSLLLPMTPSSREVSPARTCAR